MTTPTIPAELQASASIQKRITIALASNGAVAVDASTGSYFLVTLAANATSTVISNGTTGQIITLKYLQDATGSRTYVWPTNCKFGTGVTTGTTVAAGAPSDGTASKGSAVTFHFDGTNWNEISRAVAVG